MVVFWRAGWLPPRQCGRLARRRGAGGYGTQVRRDTLSRHSGHEMRQTAEGSTAHEATATTDRPHRCPIQPPIRARRRGDTPGPAAAAAEYTRSAGRRSPQPAHTRGRRARPGRAPLPAAAPPPPTQPPRDGQFPIDPAPPTSTGAAPAVSSPEAYRTPAARPSPPSVHGRHPITLNRSRLGRVLIADTCRVQYPMITGHCRKVSRRSLTSQMRLENELRLGKCNS